MAQSTRSEELEEERLMRHVLKKTTTRTTPSGVTRTGKFHVHLKAIPVEVNGAPIQLYVEGEKIYESSEKDINKQTEEVTDVRAEYTYGQKTSVSVNLKIPIMGVDIRGTFELSKGEYLLYEGTEEGLKTVHQSKEI